jgi:hypothetical protein
MQLILLFFMKNWKTILIVSLFVGIYVLGFCDGRDAMKSKWEAADAARKIADDKALIMAQTSVITKERENTQITNEVSNGYESKITSIDSVYAGVLNGMWDKGNTSAAASGLPELPATTSGHNGCTSANGLSSTDKAAILKSAHNAEVQTARLVACQGWIAAHLPVH